MRSWLPQTQQRNINIQMAPPVNTTKLLQTAFPSVAPYDQKKKRTTKYRYGSYATRQLVLSTATSHTCWQYHYLEQQKG